jgi:hypothetical protein
MQLADLAMLGIRIRALLSGLLGKIATNPKKLAVDTKIGWRSGISPLSGGSYWRNKV